MQNIDNESNEKPGVFIQTFGCQMNEYDTQKLYKLLENSYRPVAAPQDAELVLINTCSVRDKPEQKLYSWLGEMRDLKSLNPKLLVGVGGCVAQQEGQKIVKRSKAVDFVFGTHNLSLVPSLVNLRKSGSAPQVAIDYRDEWEELPLGFSDFDQAQNRVSVFISISRGCNKNCAYCIVPRTRGPEVSRDAQEILREVRIAVHRGAKEIVLLGQTVNSYGLDLVPRLSFSHLLGMIAEQQGVERIRFTSPHPQEVRKDFFELIRNNPKICKHVHMPLQSGSNTILKAMNRNYRRERYLKIIDELKAAVPDIGITTDVIVGFPGESAEDFEQTLDLMRQVGYQNSYSFMFSARPGTVAASLKDDVSAAEKLRRLQVLQTLQYELSAQVLQSYIGQTVQVLLDGCSSIDAARLHGRTSQNISLNLLKADASLKPGMLISAQVKEAAKFSLKGDHSQYL